MKPMIRKKEKGVADVGDGFAAGRRHQARPQRRRGATRRFLARALPAAGRVFCLAWACGIAGCVLDPVPLFDRDGDGYGLEIDCDDTNADVGPQYRDDDLDGFGVDKLPECGEGRSYATVAGDCDDADAERYPGAAETCNLLDDDCDGEVDEGLEVLSFYRDDDADGYGDPEAVEEGCAVSSGRTLDNGDCDDLTADVHPGAAEQCNNRDDDCDGDVDEDLKDRYFVDQDQDGFGQLGTDGVLSCTEPVGYADSGGDCDDEDAEVHPGALELCDQRDNDCDGQTDEGAQSDFYQDFDGDGYGDPDAGLNTCSPPANFVDNDADCDDNDAQIYPGATETCNGLDDDCGGTVDDGVQVAALAAGQAHSLALCSDGSVWAWGHNARGQLGNGATEDQRAPVRVKGLSDVIAITAGGDHSLAIRDDDGERTLWAWGANENGQLGDNTVDDRSTPVSVSGMDDVIAASAGGAHSLAIRQVDGAWTVWSWGANHSGQLGDGTTEGRSWPEEVDGPVDVAAIAAGGSHSVALSMGGLEVTGPEDGAAITERVARGDRVASLRGGPLLDGNGHRAGCVTTARPERVTEVSGGSAVAARTALDCPGQEGRRTMAAGTVWTWGLNDRGQLGDGTREGRLSPVTVELSDVTAIAAGDNHTLAVTSASTGSVLWTWGANELGQLGVGSFEDQVSPVGVQVFDEVARVEGGGQFSLVVAWGSGDTVARGWSWGNNSVGQLGNGELDSQSVPVQVLELLDIMAIAAGGEFGLAVTFEGGATSDTVWSWGANDSGQLGDPSSSGRSSPGVCDGI